MASRSYNRYSYTGHEKGLENYSRDQLRSIAISHGIKLSFIIEKKFSKNQLIEVIKGNKQYQSSKPTLTQSSRVAVLKKNIQGMVNPDQIMKEIIKIFKEVHSTAIPGYYYTYIYDPITKGPYDQFPLIAMIDRVENGYRGLNFHWNRLRNYADIGVVGNLMVIHNDEIEEMKKINYSKFLHK
jgi:hypothetical protein